MPYCTLDDLKKQLSYETLLQLCDDDNVGEIVTDPANTAYDNVVAAIAEGDALIDSHIANRYTLPVTVDPLPTQLVKCSVNLAVCSLFDRRRELDVPEGVERRRKQWLGWLKDVQAKRAHIPDLEEQSSGSGILVSKTENDRIFTGSKLAQY